MQGCLKSFFSTAVSGLQITFIDQVHLQDSRFKVFMVTCSQTKEVSLCIEFISLLSTLMLSENRYTMSCISVM